MSTDISTSEGDSSSVFKSFSGTHVGMRREENQDSHMIIENDCFSCFIVADGMGGAQGGAVASSMAIEVFKDCIEQVAIDELNEEVITDAIQHANSSVFKMGSEDPSLSGMGTTFVGALMVGDKMFLFNVGDSRIYRLRDRQLTLLTEDHTLIMDLIRSGAIDSAQAENHPVSHMLTRSLGPAEEVTPDCWLCEDGPARGDRYIFCSDGLYNMVPETELKRILSEMPLPQAVEENIRLANENGGTDNITVIALEIGESFLVGPETFRPEPVATALSEVDVDEDTMELHLDDRGIITGASRESEPGSSNGAATGDLDNDDTQELKSPIISENVDLMEFRNTGEPEATPVEEVVRSDQDPLRVPTEAFDISELEGANCSSNPEQVEQVEDIDGEPQVTGGGGSVEGGNVPASRVMTFCLVFFFGVAVTLVGGLLLRYQRLSLLIDQSAESRQRGALTATAVNTDQTGNKLLPAAGDLEKSPGAITEPRVDEGSFAGSAAQPEPVDIDTEAIEQANMSSAHGLSQTQVSEISGRKKLVRARIKDLEGKLTLLNQPLSGDIGQRLKEASQDLTRYEQEIDGFRSQIDVATRKVAVWYGRRKRLQDTDHISLASEVAASAPEVRKAQVAFNESTWDYLREAENLRYDPDNAELKEEVSKLTRLRNSRLEELKTSVAKSIEEQAERSHQKITELTLARDAAEQKLDSVRSELKYLRVLMSGNQPEINSLKKQLVRQLDASRSELDELRQILPQ